MDEREEHLNLFCVASSSFNTVIFHCFNLLYQFWSIYGMLNGWQKSAIKSPSFHAIAHIVHSNYLKIVQDQVAFELFIRKKSCGYHLIIDPPNNFNLNLYHEHALPEILIDISETTLNPPFSSGQLFEQRSRQPLFTLHTQYTI